MCARSFSLSVLFLAATAAVGRAQESPTVVFRSVSASLMAHTCALTDTDRAYCWGLNATGQLGSDSARDECREEGQRFLCSKRPVPVAGRLTFATLATGSFHTCGLTTDGVTYCWGLNDSGQLGVDSAPDLCFAWRTLLACSTAPLRVADGHSFVALTAGGFHTCGITVDSTAYCWGNNQGFQLGASAAPQVCRLADQSTPPCSRTPVPLPGGLRLAAISAGDAYTCGLTTDGLLYCWGYHEGYMRPATVSLAQATAERRVSAVSVGENKVCALVDDGLVSCWGVWNEACCLRTASEEVRSLDMWRAAAVTTGGEHACSLDANGTAACWGDGRKGRLGLGGGVLAKVFAREPERVTGQERFTMLSAGLTHTCGVTTAGRVLCWGSGPMGQLGNGETATKRKPEPVRIAP